MKNNTYAIIMAGGIGSRFWPMSTSNHPKQFIDILGTGETLIQQTYRRLRTVCSTKNIFIVTNKEYKKLCISQLPDLSINNILCEPVMRNTAPCIAYAAFKIHSLNEDANLIIAASDHIITKELEFTHVINDCLSVTSSNDVLLTLGIKPSSPHTGYGYIQYEEKDLLSHNVVKKVKTFTEKPNQDLALNFLDSGDFLWNSGMFIWSVKSIRLAFRKYLRDMYDIFEEGKKFYNTIDEEKYINRVYPACKNISIDYAIMEKAKNVYVYPANFGWSDLGTWGSLYEQKELDKEGNAINGKQVMVYESENNIINIPDNKLTVVHGLNGYIIVENDGVMLICKKEDEQKIKQFVSDIKKRKD